MARMALLALIVLLAADVIFYDGQYMQTAASAAASAIERDVALRFSR